MRIVYIQLHTKMITSRLGMVKVKQEFMLM